MESLSLNLSQKFFPFRYDRMNCWERKIRWISYINLSINDGINEYLKKTANPEFGSQSVMTHDMVHRDARVTSTRSSRYTCAPSWRTKWSVVTHLRHDAHSVRHGAILTDWSAHNYTMVRHDAQYDASWRTVLFLSDLHNLIMHPIVSTNAYVHLPSCLQSTSWYVTVFPSPYTYTFIVDPKLYFFQFPPLLTYSL